MNRVKTIGIIKLCVLFITVLYFTSCAAAPVGKEALSPTKGKISRNEAIKIVVEKLAEPSKTPRGLRVHLFPKLLEGGSMVVPYDLWLSGKKEYISCRNDFWFFWFDDDPLAQFGHPTRYVILDSSTGEIIVRESEWWPVVNSRVVWGKTAERAGKVDLIFEKPADVKIQIDKSHIFKHFKPQALPGCEAWVILVCGSDDVGNTFDEDVRYFYGLFKAMGYSDDHIFYISPWTTDPGVDRTTTIANVQWAINQVAINSDAEDKVFFFYSSHGGVDFLHCRPGVAGGGNVTSTDMDNWLDTITCRQMTILLQGCHTGSFIGYYSDGTVVASENELKGDGEKNRIAITATDSDHSSYGGSSTWGSTFSGGYIESFSDATADVDTNTMISVQEAYDYALANDTAAASGLSFPHMDSTHMHPDEVYHICPEVDGWISDGPNDVGNNSYDYDSTDIWSSISPTGTTHEDPISGLINHVHVKVHNLGSATMNNVDIALYWADTSTALAWPASFSQIGSTHTIPSIAAGGEAEYIWPWYVDPALGVGHHFCFVATADALDDPMTGGPPGYAYVAPFDNNIAQKNITIVNTQSGQSAIVSFFIANNMRKKVPFDLVISKKDFPGGELLFVLPDELTKMLQKKKDLHEGIEFMTPQGTGMLSLHVTAKEKAVIRQIMLEPMQRKKVSLKITPPAGKEIGERFRFRIEETVGQEIIGANTFEVRIIPKGDCRTVMAKSVEIFSIIAHRFNLQSAVQFVEIAGEGLANCADSDKKSVHSWAKSLLEQQKMIGKELKRKIPRKALTPYFDALERIEKELNSLDVAKIMVAEDELAEAARDLVGSERLE